MKAINLSEEKKQSLVNDIKSGTTVREACKRVGVSAPWYYQHRRLLAGARRKAIVARPRTRRDYSKDRPRGLTIFWTDQLRINLRLIDIIPLTDEIETAVFRAAMDIDRAVRSAMGTDK